MKIKSEVLQRMVAKVVQGCSNNKMLPLTSLIGITCCDGLLTLTTTDGSCVFEVKEKVAELDGAGNFYSIVNAEQFAKLISKTTKEYVELHNNENYLEVVGNGTYKLDIAINEEGQLVQFKPEPVISENTKQFEVNIADLQNAIKVAKASIAKTMEIPFLTGYLICDEVVTTDRQLVCKLEKLILPEPVLISSVMADLLMLFDLDADDKLVLYKQDNTLMFSCKKYCLFGNELEGKEDFVDKIVIAINNLTSLAYTNTATVSKQELLGILDRMEVFVSDYDKNSVFLRFDSASHSMQVQSRKSNAIEELRLKDTDVVGDFEYLVDIEMLKSQLQSLSSDEVHIQYGNQKSIQLKENELTLVIALLDKEE